MPEWEEEFDKWYPTEQINRARWVCKESFMAGWHACEDAAQQLAETDAGGTDKDELIALKVLAMLVTRRLVSAEAVNRALEVRGSRYCIFDHAGIWDVGTLPASSAGAA